jgi:hypothetical protein
MTQRGKKQYSSTKIEKALLIREQFSLRSLNQKQK